MQRFNRICRVGIVLLLYPTLAMSLGFDTVYDPWNEVQTTATATNTATALVNQAEQIKMELQNLKNFDGNTGQWGNAQALLQQLGDTIAQGKALSYNMRNLDQTFQQKFPGYKAQQNYQTAYQDWSQSTLDTLRTVLNSVGIQANNFASEQAALDRLAQLSQTAQGHMQAIQVGNMIATQQVSQMQQLRQLVASQTNAQNTYAAYEVSKAASQQAAVDQFIAAGDVKPPQYGTGKGFNTKNLSVGR